MQVPPLADGSDEPRTNLRLANKANRGCVCPGGVSRPELQTAALRDPAWSFKVGFKTRKYTGKTLQCINKENVKTSEEAIYSYPSAPLTEN